ncbi:endoglucanase 1 precursor [Ruminiclostridium hungatei]|uniref:Endoglucanase 1 n=1 Tax=Ruminiclostridium hungatei TaxID=48256 RepID=A0A1V4ST42_RUMHU|nr:cellulose binding domain-containing protein [Ruminiclostridium hungatei]OPX46461.1 endoglucanase 1 precursor [Ruminiclostridium hungatei]
MRNTKRFLSCLLCLILLFELAFSEIGIADAATTDKLKDMKSVSQTSGTVSKKHLLVSAAEEFSTTSEAVSLKVQMYNSNKASSSNTIFPYYKIYNAGEAPVALSTLKIRYYYTAGGNMEQNFWCDWSGIGSSNVEGAFFKMAEKKKDADTYLEISFRSEAGSLEPGADLEIKCRIAKVDWSNYEQSDDYSFNNTATEYSDWNKTTGYLNGRLVWGLEPGTEGPADITPPSVPENLSSYSISDNEISLVWSPSADDQGVSGYVVYREGMEIARVEGTSFKDLSIQPGITYTYEIAAYDYSANFSGRSRAVMAKAGENISAAIKLQLNNANKSNSSNTIFPWYNVVNTGNVPVNLDTIKLRYYYTVNGDKKQNFWCDWSSAGSSNITGTFIKMPSGVDGADYCLEIGFKSGSGVLQPGKSVELQCRIAKEDWANYSQDDDYSFKVNSAGYADWSKVTGYINGKLIWGQEPIAPISNFRITAASREIALFWDQVLSAAEYELETDGEEIVTVTGTSYIHTDLLPGTIHKYRIRAKNQIMYGPWSEYLTGITLLDMPSGVLKEVSESSITVSWEPVEGAVSYDLEVDGVQLANGTNTWYTLEQLEMGTLHTIRFRAVGRDVAGEWTRLMQIRTLPQVPEGIKTTKTSNSITLEWSSVAGASGYEVEVYGNIEDNGSSTYYTLSGLEPNTQRTFRIRAKNPDGTSAWSPVIAASTLPGASFNVNAEPEARSITVSWERQPGAVYYEIEIDGTEIRKVDENLFEHKNLEPNTEHAYRIRAGNSDGVTGWSPVSKAVTLPDVPANLLISSVASNGISLKWDRVTGVTGYDIEVDGRIIDNGESTGYTHTALTPNTEHNYRVRARTGSVAGAWSSYVKGTTLLPAPGNLKATSWGNEIRLTWDMVLGVAGYEIEIDGTTVDIGLNTEYVQSGLNPGLSHVYRVRARNENGRGDWSTLVTQTTLLAKPSNLMAISKSNSIILSWNSVDGASSYDVMADGKLVGNIGGTTYTHNNLEPNSMHTYRVRAVNSQSAGEWSDMTAAFTTVGVPGNIEAFAKSTEISITWDEVDGAEAYDVMADGKVVANGADTVYTHKKLLPNTVHKYSVRARNKNGESAWSSEVSQLTGPGVPVNIKAIPEISQISLSWEKPEGAAAYEVEVDGEIVEDIKALKFIHKELDPNTRHEYRLRAKNKEGVSGDWSELLEVNTLNELIIDVEKDNCFNFVIAVPKKAGVDSYEITVSYVPEDVEIVDLYAATPKLELETGSIAGTNITIEEIEEGRIVYRVENADKSVVTIIKFISKTNAESRLSYTVK